MWVRINKWSLIFGINQKQWQLVRKELRIRDNTFGAIQLPIVQLLTAVDTCTHWVPIFISFYSVTWIFSYIFLYFLYFPIYFPIFNIQKACPWNVQVDKDLLDFTWTGLKEQEIVNTRAN